MSSSVSLKTRIMGRMVTAKTRDEWLSIKTLASTLGMRGTGAVYKTLERLLDDKLIVRVRAQPQSGRWFYQYQASELGQVLHETGGLPRGAEKVTTEELDVIVRSIAEVLDTGRVKWESRQVVVALDPFIAGVLRSQCAAPRKKDRAKQVTHAASSFVIVITNTGIATMTLKDPMIWDKHFSDWVQRAGISKTATQILLKQIWNQIPGGTTRAEIPVLEQMFKRLQVQCNVVTRVNDDKVVESDINYSMNEIGLEYFGGTRWVDALVRTLIGLQHSTVVSEVARDQWLEDVFKALEQVRQEREAAKVSKEDITYII